MTDTPPPRDQAANPFGPTLKRARADDGYAGSGLVVLETAQVLALLPRRFPGSLAKSAWRAFEGTTCGNCRSHRPLGAVWDWQASQCDETLQAAALACFACDVLEQALREVRSAALRVETCRSSYLSRRGRPMTPIPDAKSFASDGVTLLCGRIRGSDGVVIELRT